MRITILTLGTHGDVQPFVALGLALQRSGHSVRLAGLERYRALATGRGLAFASLGELPAGAETPRDGIRDVLRVCAKLLHAARVAGSFLPGRSAPGWPGRTPWLDCLMERSWQACEDAEAIISGILVFWVSSFAEKLGVPCYLGLLQPCTATRRFPTLLFTALVPSWVRLGGRFNRLTHRVAERIFFGVSLRLTKIGRQEILGLPPLADSRPIARFYTEQAVILYAYSPTLSPKPHDWPAWNHVTGFWYLDRPADWRPPAALVDFLSAGPRPICVGFGSFAERDPARLTRLVLDALTRTGQRAVLLTGWGGLGRVDLPDTVFPFESVPHDWLFPRMSAVVHHAGAGTTGAVLRAGVPAVTVPWRGDHPFFAQSAFELGTSARPIPKRRLSAARLAAAIDAAINDPRLRERAAAVAREIGKEDGLARAVAIVDKGLGGRV